MAHTAPHGFHCTYCNIFIKVIICEKIQLNWSSLSRLSKHITRFIQHYDWSSNFLLTVPVFGDAFSALGTDELRFFTVCCWLSGAGTLSSGRWNATVSLTDEETGWLVGGEASGSGDDTGFPFTMYANTITNKRQDDRSQFRKKMM